jgi:hypothetical protein
MIQPHGIGCHAPANHAAHTGLRFAAIYDSRRHVLRIADAIRLAWAKLKSAWRRRWPSPGRSLCSSLGLRRVGFLGRTPCIT